MGRSIFWFPTTKLLRTHRASLTGRSVYRDSLAIREPHGDGGPDVSGLVRYHSRAGMINSCTTTHRAGAEIEHGFYTRDFEAFGNVL
jgi:hypothetical protein